MATTPRSTRGMGHRFQIEEETAQEEDLTTSTDSTTRGGQAGGLLFARGRLKQKQLEAEPVPTEPEPLPTVDEDIPEEQDPTLAPIPPDDKLEAEPVPTEPEPDHLELRSPGGVSNPTLAFGLAGISDWNPGMQFIDLMKMARPWIGHEPGQWGGMSVKDLREGGFLDEKGWLTSIPDGVDKVGTIWAWGNHEAAASSRAGTYTLTYEGDGLLELGLGVNVLRSEPGKIVFENPEGRTFVLNILETDPQSTGNYIRDISIVHERHLDLHEAGGLFNPDWLELIENARQIRFMDWQETNNSSTVSWEQRSQPDGLRTADGIAVEDMVHLANLVGSDPWFTMPHLADDDYIRAFATYVRDNLDPALTVRVEYSNEWWNYNFQQTQWLSAQAQAEWGDDSFNATLSYGAKMATNMAVIWREVFAEEPDGRLVTVLGSQAGNPWVSGQVLNAPRWKQYEPDAYLKPASVFDELAITSYFGTRVVSNEANRDALLAAIDDPEVDAGAMVRDWLLDPSFRSSIPESAMKWADHQTIAHAEGLGLTSYEGGQHVHHMAFLRGITVEQEAQLTEFMAEFVRSEYMAELYAEAWDAWAAVSDGPFMQFVDVGAPSKWGSWGTYSHLGDETPRSQLLETLNATTQPWWEAEGGTQYQMGIIGGNINEDNFIVGTNRKDFLIGNEEDNVFLPGLGDDHINGGEGFDRVILSGSMLDYTVRLDGNGYRVDGPDGSNFLINVQVLSFDNDLHYLITDLALWVRGMDHPEPIDLADMVNGPDDQYVDTWDDLASNTSLEDTDVILSSITIDEEMYA